MASIEVVSEIIGGFVSVCVGSDCSGGIAQFAIDSEFVTEGGRS